MSLTLTNNPVRLGQAKTTLTSEEMEALRHSQDCVARTEKAAGRLDVWGHRNEHESCLWPGWRGAGVPPPVLRREQPSQVSPLPPG